MGAASRRRQAERGSWLAGRAGCGQVEGSLVHPRAMATLSIPSLGLDGRGLASSCGLEDARTEGKLGLAELPAKGRCGRGVTSHPHDEGRRRLPLLCLSLSDPSPYDIWHRLFDGRSRQLTVCSSCGRLRHSVRPRPGSRPTRRMTRSRRTGTPQSRSSPSISFRFVFFSFPAASR